MPNLSVDDNNNVDTDSVKDPYKYSRIDIDNKDESFCSDSDDVVDFTHDDDTIYEYSFDCRNCNNGAICADDNDKEELEKYYSHYNNFNMNNNNNIADNSTKDEDYV